MSNNLDLGKLFQGVSTALVENKEILNQADTMNHDHGDNMVEVFKVINKAMKKSRADEPSQQLAYASRMLRKQAESGSAQMYADGLAQAANQFRGKSVTPDNAMELIQSLLGGGQAASPQAPTSPDLMGSLLGGMLGGQSPSQPAQTSPAQPDLLGSLLGGLMGGGSPSQPAQAPQAQPDLLGSLLGGLMGGETSSQPAQTPQAQPDLLGSLLGGMLGGQTPSQPTQASPAQPDHLGSLLGGLMGGQTAPQQASQSPTDPLGSLLGGLLGGQSSQQQQDSGLDMGDLMSAGLAYLQAKKQGKSSLEAILSALVASSRGGQTPYRAQSSALVIKSLLQMIGSATGN